MSNPDQVIDQKRPDRRIVVAALGVTQILAWGSTFYLLGVLANEIARNTGWSYGLRSYRRRVLHPRQHLWRERARPDHLADALCGLCQHRLLGAYLIEHLGWRGACFIYAAIQIGVALPILLLALPRGFSIPTTYRRR